MPKDKDRTSFFVSHDDSRNDPTYGSLYGMLLVEGHASSEEDGDNPCAESIMIRKCDLVPVDEDGIYMLARAFGYEVMVDDEGQLLLATGIKKDS